MSMKKLCHRQIAQILSLHDADRLSEDGAASSRHCSIIRNIEVSEGERVCDVTERIFKNTKCSGKALQRQRQCVDLWNLGLMMVFMVSGRRRVCRHWNSFVDVEAVQQFLCGLYLERRISTNLFDLLSFYMLIVDGKGMDTASRHQQIGTHRWFLK